MRRLLSFACVGLLALGAVDVLGATSSAASDAGGSSPQAVALVEAMRAAPRTLRFSGVVQVMWLDQGKRKNLTVDVTGDLGMIEVQSGQSQVFDRGVQTYFKNRLGWSSALVEPDLGKVPAPDHHWKLSVHPGPPIAGRPTHVVEATRASGEVAQRLFVDDATSLLMRRQVLDSHGRVERSLQFQLLDLVPVNLHAPGGVSARDAEPLKEVPSGYEAPRQSSGYELVTRSHHPNGVELLYSDGLFSVSVLEQRGQLDWDSLPAGGVAASVNGSDARRFSTASADVLVWQREGIVYTAVSDAPSDAVHALLDSLNPGRSTMERVADYVLGPFGWS